MLAGKLASASPFIVAARRTASTDRRRRRELETALQLLYQSFTAPGDDPEAFALMKRQLDASVANRGRSPGQVFGERLEQINTSNHYTSEPLTAERRRHARSRPRCCRSTAQRFANAADFTFFMVGTFKVDDALPLLARYVGSLPSTGKRTVGVQGPRRPVPATSVERDTRREGTRAAEPDGDQLLRRSVAGSRRTGARRRRDDGAARPRCATSLREELGQTYTVSVGLAQSLPQRGDGHIQVSFGAAPENIKAMTDRVHAGGPAAAGGGTVARI